MKGQFFTLSILFFNLFFSLTSIIAQEDTLILYYPTNVYELSTQQKKLLINQKRKLLKDKSYRVHIIGSTDLVGSEGYNDTLSRNRANAVFNFIKKEYEISMEFEVEGIGFVEALKSNIPGKENPKFRKSTIFFIPASNFLPEKGIKDLCGLSHSDKILIDSLAFRRNDSIPMPFSFPKLKALLDELNRCSGLKVEIQGHVHGEYENLSAETRYFYKILSRGRANYVYNFLIKNGIDESRLRSAGYGAKYPLPPEIIDRTLNRRVEIMVVRN